MEPPEICGTKKSFPVSLLSGLAIIYVKYLLKIALTWSLSSMHIQKYFLQYLSFVVLFIMLFSNNKVTIETQIEHIFMEVCQIFYLLRKHKKLRLANRCTLCVVIYFLILYSDFCINKKTCLPF